MKKFLALALALVMALALAAPAMAFTADVEEDDVYTLAMELVEYEDKDFFGILSAAPSDRGYAKNEIVAFMITFTAEKGAKFEDGNALLTVTGKSVSFNVTENKDLSDFVKGNTEELAEDGDALVAAIDDMDATKKAQTAKWIGFAKVTGDEASITAEVAVAGAADEATWVASETSIAFAEDDENTYTIHNGSATKFVVKKNGNRLFMITVDNKGKSESLVVFDEADKPYTIVEGKDGYVFIDANANKFDASSKKDAKDVYEYLLSVVEDEFEGVFGFDYDLLGGLVTRKYFDNLIDYKKLEVTVDIAPWVAYVQVPDVIVVDPPKTGDATVLVGLVMAIVAAAGVVVFNKVRA